MAIAGAQFQRSDETLKFRVVGFRLLEQETASDYHNRSQRESASCPPTLADWHIFTAKSPYPARLDSVPFANGQASDR